MTTFATINASNWNLGPNIGFQTNGTTRVSSSGDATFTTLTSNGTANINNNNNANTQINTGSLAKPSQIATASSTLGLTQKIYNHLVFNTTNNTADIREVTVVEVMYKYRPITPLPGFVQGMLNADGGGFVVFSKAVY